MKFLFKPVVLVVVSLAGVLPLMADEREQVVEIRKWYAAIEADKNLKTQTFMTGEDELPQSLEITRFSAEDGVLKKLLVIGRGEHGEMRAYYYYRDGKLFFGFQSVNEWRFTGKELADGQTEVISIASENRFYFHQDKCIKCLEKSVQSVDGDELNEVLKGKENKEKDVEEWMHRLAGKVNKLAAIQSQKDLEAFMNN